MYSFTQVDSLLLLGGMRDLEMSFNRRVLRESSITNRTGILLLLGVRDGVNRQGFLCTKYFVANLAGWRLSRVRIHVVLQGGLMLEYQPAYGANPLFATVDFMGVPRVRIVELGRTALRSTFDAFYAQMPVPVFLEAFLRGKALRTVRALDAVWLRQESGWCRLVAVPPMASVDSVRRETPLAQFAEDFPR